MASFYGKFIQQLVWLVGKDRCSKFQRGVREYCYNFLVHTTDPDGRCWKTLLDTCSCKAK
jgi:hypothetical protein